MSNYPSNSDKFRRGMRVEHASMGRGTIVRTFRADECVDVEFASGATERIACWAIQPVEAYGFVEPQDGVDIAHPHPGAESELEMLMRLPDTDPIVHAGDA